MALVTPDDLIRKTGKLSKVLLPRHMPQAMIEQFAATDVAPWMQFVTPTGTLKARTAYHDLKLQ